MVNGLKVSPPPHSSGSLGHIPARPAGSVPYSGHVHRFRAWPTPIEKERERQRDGRRLGEQLRYNWPSNTLTRRYVFNLARGGGGV